jgi:rubrerythrin
MPMEGMNRTGGQLAGDRAVEMLEATKEFCPRSDGDARAVAAVRIAYAQEAERSPLIEAVKEGGTPLLVNKLGERLAFERAGTRLYQALLSKFEAYGGFAGGPTREDIEQILTEEFAHFEMLREAITTLGGDPTELTPGANLQLTASSGICKVLADPRIDLGQSLEAILLAELADNDSWEALAELARLARADELAQMCEGALVTEQEHLEKVRAWLAASQGRPAPEVEIQVEIEGDGGNGSQSRTRRTGQRRARR